MPTISGTPENAYNHYKAQITDLEEELDVEKKRTREKQAEREARMEENNREQLQKRDKVLADAIVDIKENANDIVEKNRKANDHELARLKQQTYDRLGRTAGLEAETMRNALDDSRDGYESQIRKDKEQLAKTEKYYDQVIANQSEKNSREMDEVAQKLQESYQGGAESAAQNSRRQVEEYRKQLREQYEELNEMQMFDQNAFRRYATERVEDANRDAQKQMKHANDSAEARMQKVNKNANDTMTDTMNDVRRARNEENIGLKEQIKDMVAYKNLYLKDINQAKSDAIKDYENEFRERNENTVRSYEEVIDNLHGQAIATDRDFARKQNESLRDKDRYYANVIAQQNREHGLRESNLKASFETNAKGQGDRHTLDMQKTRDAYDRQLTNQNLTHAEVMQKQAMVNADTLNRVQKQNQTQIGVMEKELQNRKTSGDTNLISPAAEEALRRKVEAEYDKKFTVERARHRDGTDRMLQTHGEIVADQQFTSTLRESEIRRQNEIEKNADRSAFLNHVSDVEWLADEKVRKKDSDVTREGAMLTRNFSSSLERQKKEQQEIQANQKLDADIRLNQMKADYEFKYRQAQRASGARQNELVREYEKKLSDLKQDLTEEMRFQKETAEKQIREIRKEQRTAMEEQSQSYEQRIAQLEAQHKERERYITQNLEQEIDKVRRSHALASKKKS